MYIYNVYVCVVVVVVVIVVVVVTKYYLKASNCDCIFSRL